MHAMLYGMTEFNVKSLVGPTCNTTKEELKMFTIN